MGMAELTTGPVVAVAVEVESGAAGAVESAGGAGGAGESVEPGAAGVC